MNKQVGSEKMSTWKRLSKEDLTDADGKQMPIDDVARVVTGLMIRNMLLDAENRMQRENIVSMRHPLSGRVIKINGPSYLKLLEYVLRNELQEYVLVLNKQGYWVAQTKDWMDELAPPKKSRRRQPKIAQLH